MSGLNDKWSVLVQVDEVPNPPEKACQLSTVLASKRGGMRGGEMGLHQPETWMLFWDQLLEIHPINNDYLILHLNANKVVMNN